MRIVHWASMEKVLTKICVTAFPNTTVVGILNHGRSELVYTTYQALPKGVPCKVDEG